jgi:ribosome production factor 2
MLSRLNPVVPFEDATSLEFLSERNDASLIVVGSNSKKRPNNLVFVRVV